MSAGLVCLTCRRYVHAPPDQYVSTLDRCRCDSPRASWDGVTPAVPVRRGGRQVLSVPAAVVRECRQSRRRREREETKRAGGAA